jgi:hypothetical protein
VRGLRFWDEVMQELGVGVLGGWRPTIIILPVSHGLVTYTVDNCAIRLQGLC